MLKIASAHRLQTSLTANFAAGEGGFLSPSRSPPRYLGGYERLRQLRAGALRLLLFGDIDHAAPTFADLLQQLVASERLTHGFVGRFPRSAELCEALTARWGCLGLV